MGIILCNHPISGDKKPELFRTEGAGQARAGERGGMEAAFSSMLDDLISYHVMPRQHSKVFGKLVADHPSIHLVHSFIHSFIHLFAHMFSQVHPNRAQDR
jgi:hypothetical protein